MKVDNSNKNALSISGRAPITPPKLPNGRLFDKKSTTNNAAKEFDRRLVLKAIHRAVCNQSVSLKPTTTKETTRVVVGRDEALHRLVLRSIRRGEYSLQPAASRTRVTHDIVVGRREALQRLVNRSIRRGEVPQLKPVSSTRVTHDVVVGRHEALHRLVNRAIRRGEIPLLKPVERTRVTHAVVVGRPESVDETRLINRQIAHGPLPTLKHVANTRVTNKVVVFDGKKTEKSSSRAELLRRHAETFKALVNNRALFDLIETFVKLDAQAQKMIIELL